MKRFRQTAERKVPKGVSRRVSTLIGLAALLTCSSCRGHDGPQAWALAEDASAEQNWSRAAELWYEIHRSEEQKSVRSYYETSRALYETGDCESACALLRMGLSEHPDAAVLYELHADVLEASGFDRAAEHAYARLVELRPSHIDGLVGLGRIRLSLGLERGAREPLEHAIELDPERADAYLHLALVSAEVGDDLSAFAYYSRAFELGAGDDSLLVAAASLAMGEAVAKERPEAHEAALLWMDAVVERQPQNTPAHFLRGVHLEALGRSEEALDAYLRAAETDPGCIQALTRLARLYANLGEALLAEEMVQRALQIEEDPMRRAELAALIRPPAATEALPAE